MHGAGLGHMSGAKTVGASKAPVEEARHRSRRRLQRLVGAIASAVVLAAAFWVLHREIAELKPREILAQARSLPLASLLASVGFTVCGYLVLTLYDTMALRYVRHPLAYRHTARTAFMAFAVAHNVGVAALSGGSIRYRIYSLFGLSGGEIGRAIVFISATFALGASLLLGLAILFASPDEMSLLRFSPAILDALGIVLLAVPFVYLLATVFVRAPISLGTWKIPLPSPGIGTGQLLVSVADLSLAAAVLYILLEPVSPVGFLPFLGIYLVAIAAGLLSNVPGGIGVFEAVLLLMLPGVDRGTLLGTVLVYRLVYYVAPLALTLLMLAANELKIHRALLESSTRKAAQWVTAAAPQLIGLAVFLAGTVLLVSGATPAIGDRLNLLARFIPLPLLEISHLAGSVVGVGLLVLARGLFRRLHSAWLLAAALLAAGIFASLVKGLDYEEALVLLAVLALLLLSRDEFYRRGAVMAQSFTPGWVAAIVLGICFAVWVGFVSYRHVPYSQELWWQFALHSDAPRMLRASLVAGLAAASLAFWKLLRSGRPVEPAEASDFDPERIRAVIARAGHSSSNAALMGDKQFLWSPGGDSFVMYQQSGDHWIALGDPVGPESDREELVWSFRELADRNDGRPVFYEVPEESLPLYVDMGLTLAKLGEEAWVPLGDFSLEGSKFARFRQAINRAHREGLQFELVPRGEISRILPALRAVSDDWIKDKPGAEKGFSLGAFSEAYVANFDCAVARLDGEIVAFSNLWAAAAAGELSVDLMRYDERAPKGVMDYLFSELMLWGKDNGFSWFNLGMAPLSGLDAHELAPLWHKLGNLVFRHGDAFYNFEGLRHYKQKFDPEWRARYIACRGGVLGLPRALLESSRLISGGVSGILQI